MKKHQSKKISCILIIFLLFLCYSQINLISDGFGLNREDSTVGQMLEYEKEDWWWTSYELITETSSGNSFYTNIAIDGDNNLHVVWSDSTPDLAFSGTDTDIFYRKYNSALGTWGIIELVSIESGSSSRNPNVAVDSLGNVHVVWEDFEDYLGSGSDWDVFYKIRSSSGVWTLASVLTPDSTGSLSDVAVDIDINDNVHVIYYDTTDVLSSGGDADIFYLWYNKTLSSWSPYYLISPESTSSSTEPEIQVDITSGKTHIVWVDTTDLLSSDSDMDVFYRTFDLETLSLGSTMLISQGSNLHSYTPVIELDSRGLLHISWLDESNLLGAGTDIDVFYKYLVLNSNTLSDLELISIESTSTIYNPNLIVDEDNRLFLSWQDITDITNEEDTAFDVFFKIKSPLISTWSNLDIISTASDNTAGDPSLSIDSNGFIYCVWADYTDILVSGTDSDLFLSKFLGKPDSPVLNYIVPKISTPCNIILEWGFSNYVDSYTLYRSSTFITDTNDLTPLAIIDSNNYMDTLDELGIYYYALTATNEFGVSALSNVEYIEIVEDDTSFNLFESLRIVDIFLIAGIILLSQILVSLLIHSLLRKRKSKTTTKSKGTRKKK